MTEELQGVDILFNNLFVELRGAIQGTTLLRCHISDTAIAIHLKHCRIQAINILLQTALFCANLN